MCEAAAKDSTEGASDVKGRRVHVEVAGGRRNKGIIGGGGWRGVRVRGRGHFLKKQGVVGEGGVEEGWEKRLPGFFKERHKSTKRDGRKPWTEPKSRHVALSRPAPPPPNTLLFLLSPDD